VSYRLLEAFRWLFEGRRYQHRASSQGDWVSYQLYEDLHAIRKSSFLVDRIDRREHVLCVANRRRGIAARRGDGTFGELVPGLVPKVVPGVVVARGQVANVEIGAEAKILAKAMIKQIDRVISDLVKQVAQFKLGAGTPICVGVVGINQAQVCSSYEGKATCPKCGEVFAREQPTNGKKYPHPYQESATAEARLAERAKPYFDEFLILRYRATNQEPYPFEWVNYRETFLDYGAILTRISREYESRFSGPPAKSK
jgi:hypothetical protein